MKKKEFIDFVSKEKKFPKPLWESFLKNTFLILFLSFCLFFIGAEGYYIFESGFNKAGWTEFYSLILAAVFAIGILFHIKYEWNSDKHFKEVKTEFDASENFERMCELVKTFRI